MGKLRRAFALLILPAALLLSACQPTPNGPIVPQKGDYLEGLTEIAEDAPLPTGSPDVQAQKKRRFETIGHWQDALQVRGCSVKIDAEVIAPNMEAYPVAKLKPLEFGQEDIRLFFQLFYTGEGIRNYIRDTEGMLMEQLLYYKTLLVQLQRGEQPLDDLRPIEEQIESCEADIEKLEQELKERREDEGTAPLDTELHEVYTGHWQAEFIGPHNGRDHIMEVTNSDGFGSLYFYYHGYDRAGEVEAAEDGEGLSKADALAQTYMEALGIEDAVLYSASKYPIQIYGAGEGTIPVYSLDYVRSYDGVTPYPTSTMSEAMSTDDPNDIPYGRVGRPEQIGVVTDGEEIYFFTWENPYAVETLMRGDEALISQEEAQNIALTHLKLKLADTEAKEVVMTEFRLSGMYVAMKDEPDAFLLVPVWDLLGYREYEHKSIFGEYEASFVTINAIDGSIMNRNRGY